MQSTPLSNVTVDLRGKVAIVTGAGSGIGREVARNLVSSGASVLATDRSRDGLKGLLADTADLPGECAVAEIDLLDPAASARILDAAVTAYGPVIDLAALCAGIFETSAIEDVTSESFDRVVGVNLKAPVLLLAALRPQLGAGAAIVLVASGTSIGPTGYQGVYAATKAGVAKLAASLAAELGPAGIRVNAVSPGFTDTPMIADSIKDMAMTAAIVNMTPDRTIGTVRHSADAVLFLLSDAAAHIHGINLPVDGGFSQVAATPPLRTDGESAG